MGVGIYPWNDYYGIGSNEEMTLDMFEDMT
jgi:hypothetical protein